MRNRQFWVVAGVVFAAALLLASWFRPVHLQAYSLPEGEVAFGPSVAVAGDGESAWVVLNNKVYYVTLRPRAAVENRTITVIDDEELR